MGAHDDIRTVALAQSGDLAALDRLFRSVQDRLYERVLWIAGGHDAAEDVVQDVFIILQRKLKWLRDARHFEAWALRIATREAHRHIAKKRRRSSRAVEHVRASAPEPDAPDPIRALAAEELRLAVGDLPPAGRAVLILHYLDGLPLSQVAHALELPVGTVKSRLSYGLELLRRRLEPDNHLD